MNPCTALIRIEKTKRSLYGEVKYHATMEVEKGHFIFTYYYHFDKIVLVTAAFRDVYAPLTFGVNYDANKMKWNADN